MRKAGTSKHNSLRIAAWAILATMIVLIVACIVASIRDAKRVELAEDGFFVRGDYVNLDGFLRSKQFIPRTRAIENNVVTIRYRKNDGTEIRIIDSDTATIVSGTNIPEAAFAKSGNLKECHLCWIFSRDDPSDPGAADMMLPVEAVVLIFNSEGGQRK